MNKSISLLFLLLASTYTLANINCEYICSDGTCTEQKLTGEEFKELIMSKKEILNNYKNAKTLQFFRKFKQTYNETCEMKSHFTVTLIDFNLLYSIPIDPVNNWFDLMEAESNNVAITQSENCLKAAKERNNDLYFRRYIHRAYYGPAEFMAEMYSTKSNAELSLLTTKHGEQIIKILDISQVGDSMERMYSLEKNFFEGMYLVKFNSNMETSSSCISSLMQK